VDSKTLDYYSRNAAILAERYASVEVSPIEPLIGNLEPGSKVLDVGCGTGRDLRFLIQKGFDAYGVDPSSEMLDEAGKSLRTNGCSIEGRLAVGGLPDLSMWESEEFDAVFCTAVLMHIPEESIFDAAYELRRVLKIGGSLFVSVSESRPDIDGETRRDQHGRLFSELPPDKLRLLFERTGFRVEWQRLAKVGGGLIGSGRSKMVHLEPCPLG